MDKRGIALKGGIVVGFAVIAIMVLAILSFNFMSDKGVVESGDVENGSLEWGEIDYEGDGIVGNDVVQIDEGVVVSSGGSSGGGSSGSGSEESGVTETVPVCGFDCTDGLLNISYGYLWHELNPTTGMVISWNTTVLATSQIEIWVNDEYSKYTIKNESLKRNHNELIGHRENFSYLAQNTSYKFRVISEDVNGVVLKSNFYEFKTKDLMKDFTELSLDKFSLKDEEWVYQRFGNDLLIMSENFWVYESENSASIGFETNLPSRTYLEYGFDTSYGSTTESTERYYFNHLHYLRNLEVDKTYHYRIVAVDERGNIVYSGDKIVNTKIIPNAIYIPGDLNPNYDNPIAFFLNDENSVYVLKEDFVVSRKAFYINQHNITIDLNGHTVVYDEGKSDIEFVQWNYFAYALNATMGVHSAWSRREISIFNGIIKQGKNSGAGNIGHGFNPIFLRSSGDGEIAGLTLEYSGESVVGIRTGNDYVHHNVIYDKGFYIDNRHQAIRSIYIGIKYPLHNNLIKRTRHRGLQGGSDIYSNEIYGDSYATNAILIPLVENREIYNNKIFGTGYHINVIGWGANISFHDNFIYLYAGPGNHRSNEYGSLSSMNGIRLTQYGGSTKDQSNNRYEGNYIIIKGEGSPSKMRGIQMSHDPYVLNNSVINNYFKIISLDNETSKSFDHYSRTAACFVIQGNPDRSEDHAEIIYANNTCITNINAIRFGDAYGIGSNATFINNTFIKVGENPYFKTIKIGFWYWDTKYNKLIDNVFLGGANFSDARFLGTGDLDYYVGYMLKVVVGTPDVRVRLINEDLGIDSVYYTDESGEVEFKSYDYYFNSTDQIKIDDYIIELFKPGFKIKNYSYSVSDGKLINFELEPESAECVANDVDSDGFGVGCIAGLDCLEGDPDVNPFSLEICNGVDDNCVDGVDEVAVFGTTTCGLGVCAHTIDNCEFGGFQTCDPFEGQLVEICENGIDEDCDGFDSACDTINVNMITVDGSDFGSNPTLSVEVSDNSRGLDFVSLYLDINGDFEEVDRKYFSNNDYIWIEAEDFSFNGTSWQICGVNKECDSSDFLNYSGWASNGGYAIGTNADEFNMSIQRYFKSGEYKIWTRAFKKASYFARVWNVSLNGFVFDELFGDGSGDIGTYVWEYGGSYSVPSAGFYEIEIIEAYSDAYWIYSDIILFTNDLNFNPGIDCGNNVSTFGLYSDINKFSNYNCGLGIIESGTVDFDLGSVGDGNYKWAVLVGNGVAYKEFSENRSFSVSGVGGLGLMSIVTDFVSRVVEAIVDAFVPEKEEEGDVEKVENESEVVEDEKIVSEEEVVVINETVVSEDLGEGEVTVCVDNDNDGLIDCLDDGCSANVSCVGQVLGGVPSDYISYHKFEDNYDDETGDNSRDRIYSRDDTLKFVDGVSGKGLDFYDNDLLREPTNKYDFNSNGFSYSIWFKIRELPVEKWENKPLIFATGDDWHDSVRLSVQKTSNDKYSFYSSNGFNNTPIIVRGSMYDEFPYLNEWVHVVLTWDTEMFKMYVDGEEVSSKPVNLSFGSDIGVGLIANGFNGTIDEIMFYERALSGEEVQAIYCEQGGDC